MCVCIPIIDAMGMDEKAMLVLKYGRIFYIEFRMINKFQACTALYFNTHDFLVFVLRYAPNQIWVSD